MNPRTDNSASHSYFKMLVALQWLALPAIGMMYAFSWNQMPVRIATHFGLNNQPNGWMTREESLTFSLLLATAFAAIGSLILVRFKKLDLAAWALLMFFYLMQWIFLYANYSIIGFNVDGRSVNVAPVVIVSMVAAIAIIALALMTHRGSDLPAQPIFANETHASPALALGMGIAGMAFVAIASQIPIPPARVAFTLAVIAMIFIAAMAGSGFHYLFSPAGVEVRTLGFRLRSIPTAEIRNYAIDRWSAVGGYGIRGVGNRRAYVWGNRGVRIQTSEGEVFLGHDEPEKIVRDLDLLTRGTKS